MKTGRAIALSIAIGSAAFAAGAWTGSWRASRPETVRDAFHILYHANGDRTYNNTTWLGAPIQKCPLDAWVFQEIITELRPDVIVETGTYKGGSSYYYASLFDLLGSGRVITIDIEDYPGKPSHERITFIQGSSTSPEVIETVKGLIRPGEEVVVFLDSDHREAHVSKELSLYSDLVSVGSYLIVEDTHFNGNPILPGFGPGPMEAVEAYLARNDRFVAERKWEKFGLTFNPKGFLRRVQ